MSTEKEKLGLLHRTNWNPDGQVLEKSNHGKGKEGLASLILDLSARFHSNFLYYPPSLPDAQSLERPKEPL